MMNTLTPTQPPDLLLDPGYLPAICARETYRQAIGQLGSSETLAVALERDDGCITRGDIDVLPQAASRDEETLRIAERHLKFMLWSRGGWRLHLSGPGWLCDRLKACYAPGGQRRFDVKLMQKVYDRPFAVHVVGPGDMPGEQKSRRRIGGHLDGCRIGFDLGASDYKLAAVRDGEPVFSKEIPWDPIAQNDPAYHVGHIIGGLEEAARHLPHLDAIGGSAAGIYVNNRVKVASLFRGIPEDQFGTLVEPMFQRISERFGVPLVVVNDGDVTALTGALSLQANGILGIAMGSSEAVGYLDPEGHILGWLNELAFAPVDFNPTAAADEWSHDSGVGAQYFSQQAINRLATAGGYEFASATPLPERLEAIQHDAENGDVVATSIFETLGTYLAYTLPHYAEYYTMDHVLLLGRVMSGRGGDRLLRRAQATLEAAFPDLAARLHLQMPDDKMRRVGQAVAAASLPTLTADRERKRG